MSENYKLCIYCKLKKNTFTKEHVVPVSFGGTSKYLNDLVCSDCNRTFGEKFEGKFLKGAGLESLIRSLKGLKGRHQIPIFGDGSYGNRLFIKIKERFPPIQVTFNKSEFRASMQLISVSKDGKYFHSSLDDDQYNGILSELFDKLWNNNPDKDLTHQLYLWIKDTDVTVFNYRIIRKEFYKYLGLHNLEGDILCETVDAVPIHLTWDTLERQRMYSKMCLNTLFWLFPVRNFCLNEAFDPIRSFILTGHPVKNNFIHQWTSSSNPIVEMIGLDYDLNIGVFQYKERIYGLVYFPSIGIFIINIGNRIELPFEHMTNGLQSMNNDLCLFYSTTNGNDLFLVIERKVSIEIRKRLTENPEFDKIST